MNLLKALGLGLIVFSVSFLGVTALCDWICWHSQYYKEAEKMAVVMEE